jgi:hypothetical protein
MIDFETKLRLKTVSAQLMSIAVAKNVLIEQVFDLANREVDRTPICECPAMSKLCCYQSTGQHKIRYSEATQR